MNSAIAVSAGPVLPCAWHRLGVNACGARGLSFSRPWSQPLRRAPADFKPLPTVGPGAYEIRIRDAGGAFRVVYVAKFEEAVYVLHAFQKKTQATSKRDPEIARERLTQLRKGRR